MKAKLKNITSSAAIYGLGGMSNQIIGFLLVPLYSNILPIAEYGKLTYYSLMILIYSTFVTFGVASALYRYYPEAEKEGKERELVSTIIWFVWISAIIITILCWGFVPKFSVLLFKDESGVIAIKIVLISAVMTAINYIYYGIIRYANRAALYATIVFVKTIFGTALNVYFVAFARIGVIGILYSGLIMEIITFAFLAWMMRDRVKLVVNSVVLRRMVKFGSPLILGTVGTYLLGYSGLYFLKNGENLDMVGLYGFAMKFSSVVMVFLVNPFDQAWSPIRFQLMNDAEGDKLFSRVLDYLLFVTGITALFISVVIPDVLQIIASKGYYPAYKIVPQLCLTPILYGAYRIVTIGSEIAEKTKWRSMIILICGVSNVLLNLWLTPRYGITGALISVNISYLVLFLIMYWYSQSCYHISYSFKRILVMAATFFAFYFLIMLLKLPVWFNIPAKGLIVLTVPSALYALGFFYTDEKRIIIQMLQSVRRGEFGRVSWKGFLRAGQK